MSDDNLFDDPKLSTFANPPPIAPLVCDACGRQLTPKNEGVAAILRALSAKARADGVPVLCKPCGRSSSANDC